MFVNGITGSLIILVIDSTADALVTAGALGEVVGVAVAGTSVGSGVAVGSAEVQAATTKTMQITKVASNFPGYDTAKRRVQLVDG